MNKMKLGVIAEIQSGPFGTQLHKNEYVSSGVLMLNAKNIGNGVILTDSVDYVSEAVCKRLPRYILKKGDILFGRAGSIERHTYVDNDYVGCFQGTNCIRIRCDNSDIARYISYYLWLPELKKIIENQTGGSILSYITTDLLENIVVDLPDENIIKKVNYTLQLIERKIRLNAAINDNLQQQLKLMYDYWFTQFDFPNEDGKPYRSSGGKMVWNAEIKRDIPENWSVKRLDNLSRFRNGINYSKSETGNKQYRIVNVRNITSSTLLIDELDCDLINLQYSQAENYILHPSDIIIARSGSPGATRLMPHPSSSTIFCGFIICCSPYEEKYRDYLYCWLKQFEGTHATQTGGSILQNVSQDTLKSLPVVMPDDDILEKFNAFMESTIRVIEKCTKENQSLISLRDWLLPMLMNGQATITD